MKRRIRLPLFLGCVALLCIVTPAIAQETAAAAQHALLLENEYVRVTLTTLAPHGSDPASSHHDRFVYFLESGEVFMTREDGIPSLLDAQAEHRFWQQAGTTAWENTYPVPVRFLSFEIKALPGKGLDLHLDPAKISPEENTVIFENEDIRVVQTITPPGGGGALHSHGPMVVCSLSTATLEITAEDGSSRTVDLKPCTVLWSGPVTHRVKTIGSNASHLLHIELK